MMEAAVIFFGLCLVFAAFIFISVRLFQVNRVFVLKVLKYCLIIAFGVAFSLAAVAIGFRIQDRHESSYSRGFKSVSEIWGGSVSQRPAGFYKRVYVEEQYEDEKTGEYKTRMKQSDTAVGFVSQDVALDIKKNIRKKGLLFYAGFSYTFSGSYEVKNSSDTEGFYLFYFPLPEGAGNITGVSVTMDGKPYTLDTNFADGISYSANLAPGESHSFSISYNGQGTETFSYDLAEISVSIDSFKFSINTDFTDIRIPDGAMIPGSRSSDDELSVLKWELANLVSRQDVSVTFPLKQNHGKLVSKMFFYSPLTIFLFIAYLLILSVAREIKLHPMHFLFLITGFFIFYLFFSYIVSYFPVIYAVPLSGLISTLIVLYYTFLIKKGKESMFSVFGGLVIFQWIFSTAFFFPEHTGFIITIASIVSFVILMRATAHVEWEDKW